MIYMDNAATTKPRKEVIDVINQCLSEDWGNPSSPYSFGIKAREIVNKSRKTVADFIGADPTEIIFTSGASEASSLAICGFLKANLSDLFVSSIEHKSILDIAKHFYSYDFEEIEKCFTTNAALHKILCKSKTNQAKFGLQNKRSLGFPLDCPNPAS